MRLLFRSIAAIAIALPALAQQPALTDLTVDAIFARGAFAGAPMPDIYWLPDGKSWVTTQPSTGGGDDIIRVDAATGASAVLAEGGLFVDSAGHPVRIEGITLSADGKRALVFHSTVRVWRLNTKGRYSVVEFATKHVWPMSATAGLQMFAKFSPDGEQAAFVRDNNLYVVNLTSGAEFALTKDGSDIIVNGTSDWVYEEELGIRDGFRWSPDGKRIAFYRFDQSPVPFYPLLDQSQVHAKPFLIRYPQPGDPNSLVKIGVSNVSNGHTIWMNTDSDSSYLASLAWIDADTLAIQKLNRRQDRIDLLFASATSGAVRRVLVEAGNAWVDVEHGAPFMLADGKMFLWPSEQSGWRRYYLYQRDGTPVRPVTPDSSDAMGVAALVAKTGEVFITEAAPRNIERQVFGYHPLRKPERVRVTTAPGNHSVNVSSSGRYFIDIHSSGALPRSERLFEYPSLAMKRDLVTNAALRESLARLVKAPEFFLVPMPDGTKLNAFRIVGLNFDSTKPHPVLMYVYGGPNSQTVLDAWGGSRELWHQFLASRGYVVVCVDNRGTGARGAAFRHLVYQKMGQQDSQDQIDAAKWFGRQPWADPARIAMWGWSGGGWMTALTLSRGGNIFRSGISVAPVTDFRLYDDIWTERYMRTPADNPDGYKNGSVLTFAGGMTAHYLLVHGTSDDNVHPNNTFWLAKALQDRGFQFELMMYPGKTHAIAGAATQAHLFQMMTDFLDRTMDVGTPPVKP